MDPATLLNAYFSLFTIIAVVCGIGLLACRHPITGAISLIGVMLSLAGIYGLLGGVFLGIVQILVYAGAIMMLVVFVIMVLNSAKERMPAPSGRLGLVGLAAGIALVATVSSVLLRLGGVPGLKVAEPGKEPLQKPVEIDQIGQRLFDIASPQAWYVLFEIVGVLLLVAMAGAVLLAKRRMAAVPANGDAAIRTGHA